MQRRTYEKKNAELTQSNSFPVGSPPSTSSGSPCSRAFPRFVRSRSGQTEGAFETLPGDSRYWVLTCKEVHDARNGHNAPVELADQRALFFRGVQRGGRTRVGACLLVDGDRVLAVIRHVVREWRWFGRAGGQRAAFKRAKTCGSKLYI